MTTTTTAGSPFFSVIIPTYNRAGSLARTIESLLALDYPASDFEIVVCDNNSSDATASVVRQLAAANARPRIEYIFEPRQGVHFARNHAAKVARGQVLYFTDDDVVVDRRMLGCLRVPFDLKAGVGTATGPVLPVWETTPPPWITRYCQNRFLSLTRPAGPELVVAPDDVGVFSCHQAIDRGAFFDCGGFNPENTAGEWLGDGETGLNLKLKQLGHRFAFVGDAVVYHVIPRSRMTQEYLDHRLSNQGGCDSYTAYRAHHYSGLRLRARIGAFRLKSLAYRLGSVAARLAPLDLWRLGQAMSRYWAQRADYERRLLEDPAWRAFVLKDDWLEQA